MTYSDALGVFIQGMTDPQALQQHLQTKFSEAQIQTAYESRVLEAKELAKEKKITPLSAFWVLLERSYEKTLPPRTCEKGCGFCCYQAVGLTQLEWDGILKLASEEKIDLDKIIERSERTINRVQKVLDSGKDLEQLDWHNLLVNQPCPFLEEDHSCAVYSARPLDCRLVVAFRDSCGSKKLEHAQRGSVVDEAVGSTVIAKLQNEQTPKFKRRKFTGTAPLRLIQHWLILWRDKKKKKTKK